jgi:hypothetical protein
VTDPYATLEERVLAAAKGVVVPARVRLRVAACKGRGRHEPVDAIFELMDGIIVIIVIISSVIIIMIIINIKIIIVHSCLVKSSITSGTKI